MSNVHKYPNRADKTMYWFLLLAAGIAINIGIVLVFVLKGFELDPRIIVGVSVGTIFLLFTLFAIFILYKTSPVRYAGRSKKKYDYELDHMQNRYKNFGFVKNIDGIELLVISPYGLFAISSCSFEGRLYGMDSDEVWRQSFAFKKQKNALPNPVANYLATVDKFKKKHGIELEINPVLVLLSNNKGYINSKVLYAPSELEHLFDNQKEVLSGNEIDSLQKKLSK